MGNKTVESFGIQAFYGLAMAVANARHGSACHAPTSEKRNLSSPAMMEDELPVMAGPIEIDCGSFFCVEISEKCG